MSAGGTSSQQPRTRRRGSRGGRGLWTSSRRRDSPLSWSSQTRRTGLWTRSKMPGMTDTWHFMLRRSHLSMSPSTHSQQWCLGLSALTVRGCLPTGSRKASRLGEKSTWALCRMWWSPGWMRTTQGVTVSGSRTLHQHMVPKLSRSGAKTTLPPSGPAQCGHLPHQITFGLWHLGWSWEEGRCSASLQCQQPQGCCGARVGYHVKWVCHQGVQSL